jgi:hypothetical protein
MSRSRRRILFCVAAIVVAVLATGIWIIRGPDPMAFVNRNKVALAAYKAGDPTGASVSLSKTSLVERGKYLAEAAD